MEEGRTASNLPGEAQMKCWDFPGSGDPRGGTFPLSHRNVGSGVYGKMGGKVGKEVGEISLLRERDCPSSVPRHLLFWPAPACL